MRTTYHREKILLLIDGFSAHLAAIELLTERRIQLPYLQIEFLLTNSTSKCQPLDQGIIRTWKAYYRQRWLDYIVDELDVKLGPDMGRVGSGFRGSSGTRRVIGS